jgi:two-component sensor histidine kinase
LQGQLPILKNYTTQNGLPSNEVYSLYEDSKKRIWVCTDAGIVRYNANSFTNFNSAKGLPDNTIFEVKEDQMNRIWFRSFSGRIGYIQNDSIICPESNPKILDFIKEGIISSFAFDKTGNLYLGKRNSEKISFLKISPPYGLQNVSEIWVNNSENKGICAYEINGDMVYSDVRESNKGKYHIRIYNEKQQQVYADSINLVPHSFYTSVCKKKNEYFLGLNSSLIKISSEGELLSKTEYPNSIISLNIIEKKIYCGLRLNGLVCLPLKSNPYTNEIFDKLSVTAVIKDYQNGHWYSTLEKGIFYQSPNYILEIEATKKDEEKISCVTHLYDSLYLAGYNNGKILLWVINSVQSTSRIVYEDKKAELGPILTLFKKNANTIIASGALGSLQINLNTGRSSQIFKEHGVSQTPKKIIQYGDSLICLYLKQLKIWRPGKTESEMLLISNHRLNTITFDSSRKKIFLGSLRGLYDYRYEKNIDQCKKLLNCRIQDIKIAKGKIYVATKTEGLIIIDDNKMDTVNEINGLLSNIINSVNVFGNKIWLSTNKGLCNLEFSNNSYTISNLPLSAFSDASAIKNIERADEQSLFISDDKLFLLKNDPKAPSAVVRLTGISADEKYINITAPIIFKYGQTNITISYEALFFDWYNPILYRYKLKPDEKWSYTRETSVRLPNPSYGTYQFIVQAQDTNGNWIDGEQSLQFTLLKPYWMNIWFVAGTLALIIVLVVLIMRISLRKLLIKNHKKNILRIKMYELESRVAKAQMNPHFLFNSLNSIQQFILGKDHESAYRYLSKFAKLIRKLLETNTQESILLEDEIDLIKSYIEIESLRFENSFLYNIVVDPVLLKKGIRIPHMFIQPFVENAIWHGLMPKASDRKLTVSFDFHTKKSLLCIVEDNGVGRNISNPRKNMSNKKSLALDLIKQRISLMKRIRQVETFFEISDKFDQYNSPSGTYVRIVIPILKYEYSQSDNS